MIRDIRTRQDFESLFISRNRGRSLLKEPVIMKLYWAPCGPCQRFAPGFEALAQEHPGYAYVQLERENLVTSGLLEFLKSLEREYIQTHIERGKGEYESEIHGKKYFRFKHLFPTVLRMYSEGGFLFLELLDAPFFECEGETMNTLDYLRSV